MANFENDFSCGQAHEVIEAYVDGEADGAAEALEAHLAGCPECADELALARSIKEALHALPRMPCPEKVLAGALDEIERGDLSDTTHPGFWRKKGKRFLLGLPVAAAAMLAIGVFSMTETTPPPPDDPTAEEIRTAELQIRWTLAYLAKLNQRNAETIAAQLAQPRIVSPVVRGLGRAMRVGFESTSNAQL